MERNQVSQPRKVHLNQLARQGYKVDRAELSLLVARLSNEELVEYLVDWSIRFGRPLSATPDCRPKVKALKTEVLKRLQARRPTEK